MTTLEVHRHAKRLVPRLQKKLFLEQWNLLLQFSTEETKSHATIQPDHSYLYAIITVYPKTFAEKTLEDLEQVLIHEFSHLLVSELVGFIECGIIEPLKDEDKVRMRELLDLAEERVVVQVTRAIARKKENL
jgi:hypothetical protein